MKICSNKQERCLLHVSKAPQDGNLCSRCGSTLEETSSGPSFNFRRFFQNFNWQWLNPKALMVVSVVAGFFLLGYGVYHFMKKPRNTEGVSTTTTLPTSDVLKNIKDYIQAERYDSVWAIVNRLKVEAYNIDKSATVQLSQTDAEQAHSWDMTYMNDQLNIKILPNENDFKEWVRNGNYEKIQQYINDEGFTHNDKALLVKDWIEQLKIEKEKREKLFILKSPKNNHYQNVGVYDIQKPLPSTDLIASFKSGWSLDKVEVRAALKPEIKSKVESQISALNDLIAFSKQSKATESDIQMILGGVDISKINVVIHDINGGSHNQNIKSFLHEITVDCKTCKIVPVSCTPTESAFQGEVQNIYLRDIQFLKY